MTSVTENEYQMDQNEFLKLNDLNRIPEFAIR